MLFNNKRLGLSQQLMLLRLNRLIKVVLSHPLRIAQLSKFSII